MKVSIVGPLGIGKVHARIFKKMGCNISSVLSTSKESGKIATSLFEKDLKIKTKYYLSLEELIEMDSPNAISICCPEKFHLEYIDIAMKKGIPILCEKPLFWDKSFSKKDLFLHLDRIEKHPKRKIFMNTSSSYFLNPVKPSIKNRVENFSFNFVTHGENRYENIPIDLLPHALSILYRLLGKKTLCNINQETLKNCYSLEAFYGSIKINFFFRQDAKRMKQFKFKINSNEFERIQKNSDGKYNVYLKDMEMDLMTLIEDPFETVIKNFLGFCKNTKQNKDGFQEAKSIMKLMGEILL